VELEISQGHRKIQIVDKKPVHGQNYLLIEVLFQYPLIPDIEHDPAIIMQEMEGVWKQLNMQFRDKEKRKDLVRLAEDYVLRGARLLTAAMQFTEKELLERQKLAAKIEENLQLYGKHDPELPT
jgi:hypothetical protein